MTEGLKPYPAYKPSGVPWLGDVPRHWEVRRLKQVCRLAYGDSLPAEARQEGTVPVFGSNGRVGLHSTSNTKAPCIVIGRKGSFGKVNFSADPVFAIDTTFFVDSRFTTTDVRWLFYLLGWLRLDQVSKDSAVPGLDRQDAYQRVAAFPPLPEQSAIVRFLDYFDRRIRKYIRAKQKLIGLLNEQKQTIINHAVTRGLDSNVKLKPSGVPWLGDVPEHWKASKLSRLVRSSNAGEVIDKGWWGRGEETLFTCARDPLRSDYKQFPLHKRTTGSDLLVTRNGTPYVHRPPRGAIYSNVVQRINLVGGCNREFVALALEQATRAMRGYGVSIESLNYDMWKVLVVLNPPADEQTAIVNHSKAVSVLHVRAIEAVGREMNALREYRTRLVADVVTGKVDVREVAAGLPEEVRETESADMIEADVDDIEDSVGEAEADGGEAGS